MRRLRRTATTVAAAAAFTLATGPAASAGPPDRTSIVDAALAVNAESGEFSQLIGAVVALDLVGTLDGNRQFTVFAPTDEAFFNLYAQVGVEDLNGLVGLLGVDAVRDVVLYHVAPGERLSGDVVGSSQINTLTKGSKIPVTVSDAGVQLDEAMLLVADVDVDNGVIHIINAVMMP